MADDFSLRPVGWVRSSLKTRGEAPRQGYQGAPDAWVEVEEEFAAGLEGLAAGDEILLFAWFHQAARDVLKVHPGRNPEKPLTGVFATRSPDRPNPIGLHRVRVLEIAGNRVHVEPLEAIEGTPVVDIKPVLTKHCDE